jgi:membrane fusion protein (multidrug efflux system)
MTPVSFSLPAGATVALLSLALAACGGSDAATSPAAPAAKEVGVLAVQSEAVNLTTELAGRTVASEVSEVRPQVGGIVTKRLFEEGSDVKAGQPLFQIEPAVYQANADQAGANVALAEASVAAARLRAERYAALVKIEGVSQQEADDAKAAYNQAVATVAANKAALAAARTNLKFTTVTAPIAGRIGRSAVTRGALVTASQATPLTTIQQFDPMYVDVTQSSGDYLALRRALADGKIEAAAATVSLKLNDGSTYARQGKLQFSDIAVDEATGTVTLRAAFPNPERQLLPGMYVRAVVAQGVQQNAMLVPQGAVSRTPQGGATTLVVNAQGKVEQRDLAVARAVGNRWLVTSGLKPGERVVVDGLQGLRPGMTVVPTEAALAVKG